MPGVFFCFYPHLNQLEHSYYYSYCSLVRRHTFPTSIIMTLSRLHTDFSVLFAGKFPLLLFLDCIQFSRLGLSYVFCMRFRYCIQVSRLFREQGSNFTLS